MGWECHSCVCSGNPGITALLDCLCKPAGKERAGRRSALHLRKLSAASPPKAGCYISSRGRNSVQQLNQLQALQTTLLSPKERHLLKPMLLTYTNPHGLLSCCVCSQLWKLCELNEHCKTQVRQEELLCSFGTCMSTTASRTLSVSSLGVTEPP